VTKGKKKKKKKKTTELWKSSPKETLFIDGGDLKRITDASYCPINPEKRKSRGSALKGFSRLRGVYLGRLQKKDQGRQRQKVDEF